MTTSNASRARTGPLPRPDTSAEPSAAFTPGPWARSGVRQKIEGQPAHGVFATVGGEDLCVATVWYDPQTHAGFADARLIAAAPDLLEALKAAERFIFDRSGGGETEFRETVLLPAIAKAEGLT